MRANINKLGGKGFNWIRRLFLAMTPEYSTIAINRTPIIDPGDTIKIDLYWSGAGVPDQNRLHLTYNPILVNQKNPGTINTFVKMAVNQESGEVQPVSGEDHKQEQDIDIPSTNVGLVETMFHPNPSNPEHEGYIPSRISERNHDFHSPVEVRINTADCPEGDYTIPITLTYKYDNNIKQDQKEVNIHVTGWVERHRQTLEIIAVLGVIATIGILVGSLLSLAYSIPV